MVHTPKANELCPHGLDPNICGYCWNKAFANMIDENTNLKQTVATQQARIEALVQQEYAALEELGKERRRIETLEAELKALTTVEREQLLLDAAARIEALENAAIDAVQGYEAYAESGFEEVLDPPMMALAALLQEPTP